MRISAAAARQAAQLGSRKGTFAENAGGFSRGQNRIFVLWNLAITPSGVSVSPGSPAADQGLITRTKSGRSVAVFLAAAPMQEAIAWLNRYQRFWSVSLDRLTALVEEDGKP